MTSSIRGFVVDSSALINMTGGTSPQARPRDLTRILAERRLRVPAAVYREVRKGDDPLKRWVTTHPECAHDITDDRFGRILADVSFRHMNLLIDNPGSADPSVVAMGVYYRDSGWTVVADDHGVQVACFLESVPYLTSGAFCKLEKIGRKRK